MQPYPCVTWQLETEIPNIKMFMGSMEQAVIPTEVQTCLFASTSHCSDKVQRVWVLVCPWPGAHFWVLPSLLFQEPIKANTGHYQTIKNSNCVYRASTSSGPIKSKNTQSTCPEIRGYQVEEFWITPWLVISMCTHGLTQSSTAAKSLTS